MIASPLFLLALLKGVVTAVVKDLMAVSLNLHPWSTIALTFFWLNCCLVQALNSDYDDRDRSEPLRSLLLTPSLEAATTVSAPVDAAARHANNNDAYIHKFRCVHFPFNTGHQRAQTLVSSEQCFKWTSKFGRASFHTWEIFFILGQSWTNII